ncbi:MAG: hypothetical protein JKX67_12305 [Colwellia sp.]|nr:hypothetical protein [Colwellia sp.]
MSSASQTQLGLVYQQHHSWLYKVLARRLNDNFEAADIAHDVFIS